MAKKRFYSLFLVSIGVMAVVRCSTLVNSGAGSETTNSLTGLFVNTDGSPAARTAVLLLPDAYDRVKDGPVAPAWIDTTDTRGEYRFAQVKAGDYAIEAVQIERRTRALITGIVMARDSIVVAPRTLQNPGALKIAIPDSADTANGYIYIPGTEINKPVGRSDGFLILDSVPAGTIPAVCYSAKNSAVRKALRLDMLVSPGDTALLAMPSWHRVRKIGLNTTASGAETNGPVFGFPLLIRLTEGAFVFSEARSDGADLRFTKANGAQLPYEIERWDPAASAAEIWVKVDTVRANDSAQYIDMYWGNANAVSAANGAAVFDTSSGYQGVWHFGEAGDDIACDATVNHYNGTPSGMSAASAAPGAIGKCRAFDGAASCLRMTGTAGGRLNFPAHGTYAVSAWVFADTVGGTFRKIVEKGDFQYSIQVTVEGEWELGEFENASGWEKSSSPAAAKSWHHLVGVRDGNQQRIYLDGRCADSAVVLSTCPFPRYESSDLMVGTVARSPNTNPAYVYFFQGMIDEVRILNAAPNADWVKLSYMNQKATDALVNFNLKTAVGRGASR